MSSLQVVVVAPGMTREEAQFVADAWLQTMREKAVLQRVVDPRHHEDYCFKQHRKRCHYKGEEEIVGANPCILATTQRWRYTARANGLLRLRRRAPGGLSDDDEEPELVSEEIYARRGG